MHAVIALTGFIIGVGTTTLLSTPKTEIVEIETTPQYIIQMDESCFNQLQSSDKVHLIIHNDITKEK